MNLTPQFKQASSVVALALLLQTTVNADQNYQFRPTNTNNAAPVQATTNQAPVAVQTRRAMPQAQYRANNGYRRSQNNGFMNGNNMPFNGSFMNNRNGNGMPFSGGFMNNRNGNGMPFSGGFMNNRNGNGNSMPFFGGNTNNMPFFGGNNNNNNMPFFGGNNMPFMNNNGRSNRFFNGNWINMNDPKGTARRGFDEALDAPSQMGEMPGGLTAPSISVPNPVEVGDQFKNAAEELPDQMRNMNN